MLTVGRGDRFADAAVVRLDWKLVAVTTALVTAMAWSLAAVQPPQYRASALAAISLRANELQPNEMLRGIEVLERRTVVASLAALASTPAVRHRIGSGDYFVEAVVLPNTNLVRIDAEGGDGARAAAIANQVPEVLSTYASSLFRYYSVTMVAPALRPASPFLPQKGRAIAAGILIGLFLGLVAAYGKQWISGRRDRPA